jgi:hypothetical protein
VTDQAPQPGDGAPRGTSEEARLQWLARRGAEIAPDLAGRVIGVAATVALPDDLPGRLVGTAVGVFATSALRGVAQEVIARVLSRREAQRAGLLFDLVSERILERLDAGEQARRDGFIGDGQRPYSADEITEATFLAVQRDPEERKLPFYAELLASFVFDTDIDRRYANLLVRLMRELSYAQLCVLALFGMQEIPLRGTNYMGMGDFENDLAAVLIEVGTLVRDNLVMPQGGGTSFGSITAIVPANMRIQGAGQILFERSGLRRLSQDQELRDIAAILSRSPKQAGTWKESLVPLRTTR